MGLGHDFRLRRKNDIICPLIKTNSRMNPSVIDKSKFSDVKNQNRLEKFTGTIQYRIHMTPFHNLIRFSSCQVPEVSYFVTNILVFDVSISKSF